MPSGGSIPSGGIIIPDPVAPDVDTGFPFPTFHSSAKEHPVLWDFDHYNELMEMPLPVIRTGTQNMGNGVYWLKAGTPLSSEGAVANTSAAICVAAEDFYFYENKPNQAKLVKVIVKGYVDLAEAEVRSGLTYTEDALSALETAGVVMVDGKLAASGGGGGGGLPSYTNDDLGKSLKLADSGETTTETVTTISEQTFVSNSHGEGRVTCAPEYPWILGETIHLTVNNEVHDCVVQINEDKATDVLCISAELAGGGSIIIDWWAGGNNVICPAEETYVVSATKEVSIPVAAPAWVSGGSSGGGVLVVHAEMDPGGITVDASVEDIVSFIDGGGTVFAAVQPSGVDSVTYLPLFEKLSEPYQVGFRACSAYAPGDNKIGLVFFYLRGSAGTPDTWNITIHRAVADEASS